MADTESKTTNETTNETTLLPLVGHVAVDPKPGWKTSEFWLKIAAFALTAMFASGAIPTTGPLAQVLAIAATMLGALGYTVARSMVKSAAAGMLMGLMLSGPASLTACGATSKDTARDALGAAIDCTTADRLRVEAQFGPTVELALQRAIGQDGKIDLPSLQQIGGALEADGWCVLEREAAKLIAWVATKAGTAAAVAPLDAQDLSSKLAALRARKFGTAQFQLGPVM